MPAARIRPPLSRQVVRRSVAALSGLVCAVALVSSLAVSDAGAAGGPLAAAATSPWSVQPTPPLDTSTPNAQFYDSSCPMNAWCMAVGEYVGTDGIQRTLSEIWDGSSWRIVLPVNRAGAGISALDTVSCVSLDSCQAVGFSRGSVIAESWNGHSWRMVPIQKPGESSFMALSCATRTFCFTVGWRTTRSGGSQAFAERWNGTKWSLVAPARPRVFTLLSGVSCTGPRNCYAVGWDSARTFTADYPLVEHWNGTRWRVQVVPRPARGAELNSVACPTRTSCTAVGSAGTVNSRMLVEDLSKGHWAESLPAAPRAAARGTVSLYAVSCSSPRVCSALLRYINAGEELTWAVASRGATGSFKVTVPAGDVAYDDAASISCRRVACEVVGGLNVNDGQGDSIGSGTTSAWRATGGHLVAQSASNPPGTAGGNLTSVSCVASGFCAATTSSDQDYIAPGDPSVLVRMTARGAWTAPATSASGLLTSVSCTSASFCLALGSTAGAATWNGSSWSAVAAPDIFDPVKGGLQTVSCVSSADCMAVGSTKQGAKQQALAASWDGSTWTMLAPATPAGSASSVLTGVSCTAPTDCVANGYYLQTPTASRRALIETWDGSNWTIASPHMVVSADTTSYRVSCASASACMAIWSSFGHSQAEWWNGTSWTAATFAGPTGRSDERSVNGISCTSATSCTAAGSFAYPGSRGQLVETWNGTSWSVAASASPRIGIGAFNDVSCTSPTVCTAVGNITRQEIIPFAEART